MKGKTSYWREIANSLIPSFGGNWRVVVLCILLATTFWFFNALNKSDYTYRLDYPLAFVFDDSVYIATKTLPKSVRLEVSGGGWDLLRRSLGFELAPLEVSLADPENSRYILGAALNSQLGERLSELRITNILDDTLNISLERIVNRKVRVVIDTFNIALAEDFRLKNTPILSPDSVTVRGPKSFVEALPNELYLEINERNVNTDLTTSVNLGSLGSRLFSIYPNTVEVSLRVVEYQSYTQEVKLTLLNFPAGSNYYPEDEFVKIRYKAPESDRPQALIYPWEVGVDFRRLDVEDSTLRPFLIRYPDFVTSVAMDPSRIKLVKRDR